MSEHSHQQRTIETVLQHAQIKYMYHDFDEVAYKMFSLLYISVL
jgi:hypothetical protein